MSGYWFHIPKFNGYQINENGCVRSMKNFNADPGHYMKLYNDKYYRLVDDNNESKRISMNDLLKLTFESGYELKPVEEEDVYYGSRNKVFTKSNQTKDNMLNLDISRLIRYEPVRFDD